jgi:glycosyltransferase involved in cell wall biosynthesis
MKILQINKFFYLRGGTERHFFDVSHLLEKHGQEVIYFSTKDKKNRKAGQSDFFVSSLSYNPLKLLEIFRWGRLFYSFEARRKLRRLIKKEQPDVAHVHLLYHQLSPSLLLDLKNAGIPVVLTIHDWYLLSPNYNMHLRGKIYDTTKAKHPYWKIFFDAGIKNSFLMSATTGFAHYLHKTFKIYENNIDAFIAPSKFVKKQFSNHGFHPKVKVLPHFVSSIPTHLSKVEKEPYLLYAGRLSSEKGISRLVDYWIQNDISTELRIAGTGPLEQQLRAQVAKCGLTQRIKFLGFIQPELLPKIMRKSAAVIVPSTCYETFGLTVIEAWAQGTAVFAHNLGPLPELIREGGGYTFSFKGTSLKDAITDYLRKPSQWGRVGLQGYKAVKEGHDPEKYYQNIMKIYKSVL